MSNNTNKSKIQGALPVTKGKANEEALANGWEKVTSTTNPAVVYYHNTKTGNRQWHKPGNKPMNHQGKVVPTTEALPNGWKKYQNQRNMVTPPLYWYENDKGVTYWEIPDSLKPAANAAAKNVAKANEAIQNAVQNLKIKAPGASTASPNNVFKPVFDSLQTVKEELGDLEKQLTPKATGGGRKTRKSRKGNRKTRGRRHR
jgi:hypothetical protein